MKRIFTFLSFLCSFSWAIAQAVPEPWQPAGSDSSYPRSLIHSSEIAALKSALAAGTNNDLLAQIYAKAQATPPPGNDALDDKRTRAYIAKNAAFFVLLNIRPSAGSTTPLTPTERNTLKTKAITILEEINPYVSQLSTDSPSNYDSWQWSSKQIIDYVTAYDLLKGAGVTDAELVNAREAVKVFTGTLYNEASKVILNTNFFQGAKNNHALMTASAIGMAAVVLNDLSDTNDIYKPVNWINAAMWNIHNVMWWDIRKQSVPGVYSGYAEGTYYMRYAFANMLPFFRSIGYFLPDTSIEYTFNGISRSIRNPWYDTNYVRIYDWIQAIRMPDGRMPPLEDSYIYKGFPELAILGKSTYNWPLYLSGLDPIQSNSLSAQLQDIYDLRANYIAANVPQTGFQDSLFRVFPEAGIAVWRTSWDSSATYFALTGKHGTALASAEAHNHADDGNFLMMVNGQLMALDPGYLSYEMRDTVAGANDHNMILVNGAATDYGIPGKSFGADCFIEKSFSSAVQNYAELRTHYQNTDINRKVLHVRNKYFLLADHVKGNGLNTYQWQLHGYGLDGGNAGTGTFTDMLSSNRAAWQYKLGGLFAYVNATVPLQFTKRTGVHEYYYETIRNHTVLQASNAVPGTDMAYLTCLQPFSNLGSDTIPVNTLSIPGSVAYRINEGGFTDVAISKPDTTSTTYTKAQTGLDNDYRTDAAFFWASENGGSIRDLFVQQATGLSVNGARIFSSYKPINIQYVQTGATTYSGYCGDSGWVQLYTGAYPFMFTGNAWTVSYDVNTKVASVYFGAPGRFSFILDDSRVGISEPVYETSSIQLYPNPAKEFSSLFLKNNISGCKVVVSDLSGKTIDVIEMKPGTGEARINTGLLEKGLYLLTVSGDKGQHIATRKLIVE